MHRISGFSKFISLNGLRRTTFIRSTLRSWPSHSMQYRRLSVGPTPSSTPTSGAATINQSNQSNQSNSSNPMETNGTANADTDVDAGDVKMQSEEIQKLLKVVELYLAGGKQQRDV